MSTLKLLPAIKMDPRERKVLNDNLKQTVPYTGAEEDVDITGQHLIVDLWEDLRFPAQALKLGATSKPDYDFTNNGLLFPQNDTSEIAYIIAQIPHAFMYGSSLKPHVHFIQTSSSLPTFKLAYRWYDLGQTVPAFTTITSTTAAFTYVSGSIHQLLMFPDITDATINGISSILDLQLWRDDNVVTGDVLVKEFDIHYRLDTLGSLSVSSK